VKPEQAARLAGEEAQTALDSARFAKKKAAAAAAAARRRAEELVPDPHQEMLRSLATQEQSALLRIGPRRNRWRDLLEYEERLAELEQHRTALMEEIGALSLQLRDEPGRHTAALARWMQEGENGDRPVSRVPELEAAIADRQAEHEAAGLTYDQALRERAEHVVRNRDRFTRDIQKAKEKAAAEYARHVDALEATRAELLDLRATEVWAGLFPSEHLQHQPNTQALVGARKAVQEPLLPGVQAGLIARGVFELLRADARFCSDVATVDQYAALEGVTAGKLTGREAVWMGDGKTPLIGPSVPAAWGGSEEEKQHAETLNRWTKHVGSRAMG
jgi:hypothetical protein